MEKETFEEIAKNLLNKRVYITQDDIEDVHDSVSNVIDVMVEFAKLHVEAALKEKEKQMEKLKDFETWKEWKNKTFKSE